MLRASSDWVDVAGTQLPVACSASAAYCIVLPCSPACFLGTLAVTERCMHAYACVHVCALTHLHTQTGSGCPLPQQEPQGTTHHRARLLLALCKVKPYTEGLPLAQSCLRKTAVTQAPQRAQSPDWCRGWLLPHDGCPSGGSESAAVCSAGKKHCSHKGNQKS